ncbi:MAG: class I SAM-dependent methyltransferase [Planctomycetota bacterium]
MSTAAPADIAPPWHPAAPRLPLVPQLRERLLDRTAAWLAARGIRRIALYPGGRHTRGVIRQPWLVHGIEVAAVLDDRPRSASMAGVPVLEPHAALADAAPAFDAVVLSTIEHEQELGARARELFADSGVEVVGLYAPDDSIWGAGETAERLVQQGMARSDAAWLVENRAERHDALAGVIPPARTELHARRYELAAQLLRDRGGGRAADLACGTGYGSALLARIGGAEEVVGVDLDAHAVDYATRRHDAGGRAVFRCGDATETGLETGGIDLVASFETVEHVADAQGLLAEFHRVLAPDGVLAISTPNRLGPTPYHVHDFGFAEFRRLLESRFVVDRWVGQLPTDEVFAADLPPGMWPLEPARAERDDWSGGGGKPEFLLAVCRKAGAARVPATPLRVDAGVDWPTLWAAVTQLGHAAVRLEGPEDALDAGVRQGEAAGYRTIESRSGVRVLHSGGA